MCDLKKIHCIFIKKSYIYIYSYCTYIYNLTLILCDARYWKHVLVRASIVQDDLIFLILIYTFPPFLI